MRVKRVRLLLVPLLLGTVPLAHGQSPTLRKTKATDWYREVKDALTSPTGKASREYREASRHVFLDVGPEANPKLRYNPDTFELTWTCTRKPRAFGATDAVIKNAVIAFLKHAGRVLYAPADIRPGTGKLTITILLEDEKPPPVAEKSPSD